MLKIKECGLGGLLLLALAPLSAMDFTPWLIVENPNIQNLPDWLQQCLPAPPVIVEDVPEAAPVIEIDNSASTEVSNSIQEELRRIAQEEQAENDPLKDAADLSGISNLFNDISSVLDEDVEKQLTLEDTDDLELMDLPEANTFGPGAPEQEAAPLPSASDLSF